VQVGILTKRDEIPVSLINRIIGHELMIAGSHGLQAHAYPGLLELIQSSKLDPTKLIDRQATLDEAPHALAAMDDYRGCGVTVFTPFS
jgi:alcohol dehydrogenase